MTGSGTQFNMNVNEVVSNRCCQLPALRSGGKTPVHPNDHVNMSQSSNDTFPSAMYIAAAINVTQRLIPAVKALLDAIAAKAEAWKDIVKIGRPTCRKPRRLRSVRNGQDTRVCLRTILTDRDALKGVYRLALAHRGGNRHHSAPGFAEAAAAEIARLTGLPFIQRPEQVHVQGLSRRLVQLSGTLRTLAVSLYKIGNDIRLMCADRAPVSRS